jgi:hypothetical protein
MVPLFIKVDEDPSLLKKELHFLDFFGFQNQGQTDAVGFYNQFRSVIIASLKKKGDVIMWQNNRVLMEDEELSPTFEELILAVVLEVIDTSLPVHVRKEYLMEKIEKSLMDFKSDILSKIPTYLIEIDDNLPAKSKNEEPLARYVS